MMNKEIYQVEWIFYLCGQIFGYCVGCDVFGDGVFVGGCGSVIKVGQNLECFQFEIVYCYLVLQFWDQFFLDVGKFFVFGDCVQIMQCVFSVVFLYFIQQLICVYV